MMINYFQLHKILFSFYSLFIFAGIIYSPVTFAQNPKLRFTHLTTDDGLSQSTVQNILKDKYGFIWFGTDDGLNKYDGYTFKVYRNNSRDTSSLRSNGILSLHEDKQGNLWIGTHSGGLSLYDRGKDSFIHFGAGNRMMANATINSILEDRENNLWIGVNNGLLSIEPKTKRITTYLPDPNDKTNESNFVLSIIEDKEGYLWIGTRKGLNRFDKKTKKFKQFIHDKKDKTSLADNLIRALIEDNQGNILVGMEYGGLDIFDKKSGTFSHYQSDHRNPNSISSNIVFTLSKAEKGKIWVGTEIGLNLFDPIKKTFISYKSDPNEESSLSTTSIRSVFSQEEGILWVGTYSGGINKYDKNLPHFQLYRKKGSESFGLSHKVITSFEENDNGDIWIGTDGGGLNLFNRKAKTFKNYKHDPNNKNSLSNNAVLVIKKSKRGSNFWIGSYGGGLDLFNPKTGTFKNYYVRHSHIELNCNAIYTILEAHDGRVWTGTAGGGINVVNPLTEKISSYRYTSNNVNNKNTVSDNYIRALLEDSENNIWIGTLNAGISIYNPRTKLFKHLNKTNSNLNSDHIYSLAEDSKGNIWVGTQGGGLNFYNKKTGKFVVYDERHGLLNNVINSIVEDNSGNIWVSTNGGISRFDPGKEKFKNFDMHYGLQSREFFPSSVFKASTGEVYFGGINGFNVFSPSTIVDNKNLPQIAITDFQIFNKSVSIGGENSPIKKPLNEVKEIILTYDQYMFSFEFSALNYTIPELNNYAYKLEGFDSSWHLIGTQRKASYTNLDAGVYYFKVKASNNDGLWNENGVTIKIIITPPFWMTWWFRALTVILFFGLIYALYRNRIKYIESQNKRLEDLVQIRTEELVQKSEALQSLNEELQMQSEELQSQSEELQVQSEELQVQTDELQLLNEQLQNQANYLNTLNQELQEQKEHEELSRAEAEEAHKEAERANKAKSIFLATMSHEIRTPMNGVLGMTYLLCETRLDNEQQEYVSTIRSSGESLLNIINDILDFSKIESGIMELDPRDFDLRKCIKDAMELFSGKAAKMGIDLIYEIDRSVPVQILADDMRLRQVLLNLIGNAIKFTQQGEVYVGVSLQKQINEDELELLFKVRDTGIGIPEDKRGRLFKAFSQVDSSTSRKYGGTGLGLVICDRLIQLMGGSIGVESEQGVGTCFTFVIKSKVSHKDSKHYASSCLMGCEGKSILIVDDNLTNLNILKTQLEHWKLAPTISKSGEEALRTLAANEEFDLVITDMQLSDMNGVELSTQIKQQKPYLPIILLNSIGDETKEKYSHLFFDILTKPIKHQNMFKVINALLKQGTTKAHGKRPLKVLSEDFAQSYPYKILIAEDNLINQALLVRVLNKLGYQPSLANNGKEVLEMLEKDYYELIFMDMQMPEMDGLEATRLIRKSNDKQPLIIAMTANAMLEDREECLRAGMDEYISKPIKLDELIKIMQEASKK